MVDTPALVRELQDMREEGHLSDALLRYAVRTLYRTDERFNWVGVYLLDDEREDLWLHNYLGSPTDHARIPVGQGVCGTAVAQGADRNVPDVSEFEGYLSCDPAVRSELVVLIRAGSRIYGQFDIDSHRPAAFREQDEEAVRMIADKLAEQIARERR